MVLTQMLAEFTKCYTHLEIHKVDCLGGWLTPYTDSASKVTLFLGFDRELDGIPVIPMTAQSRPS